MHLREVKYILVHLICLFFFSMTAINALASDPVAAKIRTRIDDLRNSGKLFIDSANIAAVNTLPQFYEMRNYQPAWARPYTIAQLMAAVRNAHADGFDPEDYHYSKLRTFQQQLKAGQTAAPDTLAEYDILLSDSFVRLAYHQYFGKVDPETLNPYLDLVSVLDGKDPMQLLLEAVESNRLDSIIDGLKPVHPLYRRLKAALAKFRAIKISGSWQEIPSGERLVEGVRDERIPLLRRRLQLTGDLKDDDLSSNLFDEKLKQALINFQTRHYLEPDGVADRSTLLVLNEPVQDRIDQIRANLERSRWVLHGLPSEYVLVDIAGYDVRYLKDGRAIWSGRAQVGKPYRQTPVFKSKITSIELNPTWTVPPGVFKKDILPEVKNDPEYLNKLDIKIYGAKNRVVDAGAIDWSKYPGRKFPYILRQGPGPTNPVGDIKFILPNPFYIYLHDTPEQEEFDTSWRALSAGCIRVDRPLELAELLLDDRERWSINRIGKQIKMGKTIHLSLESPRPVLLIYITVWVDQYQVVYFREDIYGRDSKILKGLESAFEFRRRALTLNPIL